MTASKQFSFRSWPSGPENCNCDIGHETLHNFIIYTLEQHYLTTYNGTELGESLCYIPVLYIYRRYPGLGHTYCTWPVNDEGTHLCTVWSTLLRNCAVLVKVTRVMRTVSIITLLYIMEICQSMARSPWSGMLCFVYYEQLTQLANPSYGTE